ncbi:hypothetical protein ACLB2K_053037 [Fragaria x ananassa]
METECGSSVTVRKTTQTPKAILHQKFGANACFTLEEVHESAENGCPGLAIEQKGPCLYRCTLQLPEITVVSGIFKKKKDAEQAAAQLALEELHINSVTKSSSLPETWDCLVSRVKYFLSSLHQLSGHVRAAFQREGCLAGLTPTCAIAVFDATLSNLCKSLDLKVESNPFLIISYVMRAAAELSGFIASSEGELWIRRQSPYSPEIIELSSIQQNPNNPEIIISPSNQQPVSPELLMVEAIIIPCSLEKNVERVILNFTSSGYYLDVIAKQLGLLEAAHFMISRPTGKASSETRLHFAAPKQYLLDISSDLHAKEVRTFEGSLNARASYLSGQDIFGDAILATIGYTWRSKDLFYEGCLLARHQVNFTSYPEGQYLRLSYLWHLLQMQNGRHYQPLHNVGYNVIEEGKLVYPNCVNVPNGVAGHGLRSLNIEGSDSGISSYNGSISCVSYSASLVTEVPIKEQLESSDDFEFEIASGALNPHIESVLIQMSVADDSTRMLSLLSSKTCCLEYTIRLLRVAEPMEQALYSPPLSKQ